MNKPYALLRFSLSSHGQGHFHTRIEQLPLVVGHFQKIGGIAESPSGRFQRFSLR